jgi:hypothetical protein
LFGDVRESTVAVVVVKDVRPVVEHVEVHVAVVIVIRRRASGAEGLVAHAGGFRDVGELALPVVLIKVVGQLVAKIAPLAVADTLGPGAIDEVDILEAVAIVVEDADAGASALDDVVQVMIAVALTEGDA